MLWLALGCVLLVVLTWAIVLLAKLPLWIAILVTVLSVSTFVTVLVVRRVRAWHRARALEKELLRLASAQATQRPDRRAEIIALREQMKAAIAGLKSSKLGGRGGSAALYALPWYAIVGPPAAGKTTALEKSGLAFTAPPGAAGPKIRGTAGTRNCDWWFSRNAVLLDTAGRFATVEEDQDEWFVFLDTIRKFRPDRPLDGLVVGVSIESLQSNPTEVEELAVKIRARIDEVTKRLEMMLPVYVLFTKLDLVHGFVEFWGDLSKSERGQAWGATFDFDDPRLTEPGQAVQAELEVLTEVIHARMLERLGRETVADVRGKILEFPLAFENLQGPVCHFVDELFRVDPYHDAPLLRGVYFSSGTQTGASMDRVLANMQRGFDLRSASDPKRGRETHSYFITELFEKVIFPDRYLGMYSSARSRRRNAQQVLIAVAALAITVVTVLPAMVSFARNRDLIADTASDIARARLLEGSANTTAEAADLLLGRVETLEGAAGELRVPGFWGPRAAPELLEALQTLYRARLRAIVDGPVQAELTANVRDIGSLVRTDAENFKDAYDDLKLYLMLVQPEHLDLEWATPRLAEGWLRAMGGEGRSSKEKVTAHARRYLDALAKNPSWAWTPDTGVIARARARLSSQPLDELQFAWLAEKAKEVPAIKPSRIFFGSSAQYFSARDNVEVRGLYTAAGWERVKEALASSDSQFNLESWVLGREQSETSARTANAAHLQDLYFERYVRAWSDFIGALSVAASPDIKTADDELRALTEANGPYVRLFRTVSENTALDLESSSLKDKALEKGKDVAADMAAKALPGLDAGTKPRQVSSVERYFEPLTQFGGADSDKGKDAAPSGLSQYLAQLTTLEVALSQLSESKESPDAAFATELGRTAAAVQRLLGGLDSRTRLLVEPLLMTPIRGSRAGVFKAEDAGLGDHWKAEVWETWNTKLAPRFPFNETGGDASLAEFSDFFRPDSGMLWKFFDKELSGKLERSGDKFVPKASVEPTPFLPAFLACMNVAQEITAAVFGTLPEAKVPFSVNIHGAGSDISQIALKVDGTATIYKNEPEHWQLAQWPGAGPTKGAAIEVKASGFTDEIPRDGDFGLFRLLLAGGLKPEGTGQELTPLFVATWSLNRPGSSPLSIELKPAKATQPFSKAFFTRMKCPMQIVAGAASGAQP